MKKLLFQGNVNDAREHIDSCKIKGCETCKTLKDFIKRTEEDGCEFCGLKENCQNYKKGILEERERILKIIDGRRIECSMKYDKWWMNLESLRESVLDVIESKEEIK